jgi:hypothetical protein
MRRFLRPDFACNTHLTERYGAAGEKPFRPRRSQRREHYQRQSLISCAATLGRSGPTATGAGHPGTASVGVGALAGLAISAARQPSSGPRDYPTRGSTPCTSQPSIRSAPPRPCGTPAALVYIDARDHHSAIFQRSHRHRRAFSCMTCAPCGEFESVTSRKPASFNCFSPAGTSGCAGAARADPMLEYAHPAFWAGFSIVGDGGQIDMAA